MNHLIPLILGSMISGSLPIRDDADSVELKYRGKRYNRINDRDGFREQAISRAKAKREARAKRRIGKGF